MEHSRIDAQTDEWVSPRATLTFAIPRPGVVVQTFKGHGTREMAEVMVAKLGEALTRFGSLRVFDDWQAVTGYDSETRVLLTEWTSQHQASVEIHVLVGSKIVAMGLAVAGLVVRNGLIVHATRGAFERALQEAVGSSGTRRSG